MEGPAVALGGAELCWLLCLMALTQPQALPASGVHPLPPVPPHPPQDVLFGSMGTWTGRRPLGGDPGWAQGHRAGASSTVSRCFHSAPQHRAKHHTLNSFCSKVVKILHFFKDLSWDSFLSQSSQGLAPGSASFSTSPFVRKPWLGAFMASEGFLQAQGWGPPSWAAGRVS